MLYIPLSLSLYNVFANMVLGYVGIVIWVGDMKRKGVGFTLGFYAIKVNVTLKPGRKGIMVVVVGYPESEFLRTSEC